MKQVKQYLSEIHTKPHKHKKRFALLVSGGFTLLIFAIWSAVTFSDSPEVVKDTTGPVNLAAVSRSNPVTPFNNLFGGVVETWDSIVSIVSNDK